MATPAPSLTPPPGADQSLPTQPPAASPSPAQPASPANHWTNELIKAVNILRGIAKAFPAAAPHVREINDIMPKVGAAMMQHQQIGEPQAPPTGG